MAQTIAIRPNDGTARPISENLAQSLLTKCPPGSYQTGYQVIGRDTDGCAYFSDSYYNAGRRSMTGGHALDLNDAQGSRSFIGYGRQNAIHTGGSYSSIVGGLGNAVSGGSYAFIGGGYQNEISGGNDNTIAGGRLNSITAGSYNFQVGYSHENTRSSYNAQVGYNHTTSSYGGFQSGYSNFFANNGNRSIQAGNGNRVNVSGSGNAQLGFGNRIERSSYSAQLGVNNIITAGTGVMQFGNTHENTAGSYNVQGGYNHTHVAGTGSIMLGYNGRNDGSYNGQIGFSHEVDGVGSMAFGYDNHVTGDYSVALGRGLRLTGNNEVAVANSFQRLGFYGVEPVARQTLANNANNQAIIAALKNLGLVA